MSNQSFFIQTIGMLNCSYYVTFSIGFCGLIYQAIISDEKKLWISLAHKTPQSKNFAISFSIFVLLKLQYYKKILSSKCV